MDVDGVVPEIADDPVPARPASRRLLGVGAVLALTGILALVVGFAGLIGLDDPDGRFGWLPTVLLVGAGPGLVSLAAVALARDLGLVTSRGAVGSATASALGWTAAALAAMSWGVGFREADAGVERSAFGEAVLPLLGTALVLGATALYPAVAGLLRGVRPVELRRLVAVACSSAGAVAIGVGALAPGGAALAALAVLLVCGARWRSSPTGDGGRRSEPPLDPPDAGEAPPERLTRRGRAGVAALAATSVVLTLPFSLYALLGGAAARSWQPGVTAQLPPMNVGLAGGALGTLPLLVAAGILAHGRWGRIAAVSASLVAAAVVARAVSAAMGPDGDAPTSLLFAAAVLVGVAIVLPFAPRVPGPAAIRATVVGVAAVAAGWVVGLPVLTVGPLVAPLVAVVLAVVVSRGARPVARMDRRRPLRL